MGKYLYHKDMDRAIVEKPDKKGLLKVTIVSTDIYLYMKTYFYDWRCKT